jgi:hypothetical protein
MIAQDGAAGGVLGKHSFERESRLSAGGRKPDVTKSPTEQPKLG